MSTLMYFETVNFEKFLGISALAVFGLYEYTSPQTHQKLKLPFIGFIIVSAAYAIFGKYILGWLTNSRISRWLTARRFLEWPVTQLRKRNRAKDETRLGDFNKPGFIESERHLRDGNVLSGLLLIAMFLLLSVFTFMNSRSLMNPVAPPVNPASFAFSVLSQLLCALGALLAFSNAMDHHKWTSSQNVEKERARLQTKLELHLMTAAVSDS